MKKLFTLLTMLIVGIGSSWADGVSDFMSDSYANAKWLSITNCNVTNYVMFATNSTMETRTKASTNYASWQLVAFVGTSDGFKIYSYSQGGTKALKSASDNPDNGTTVSWVDPSAASTWVLEETYASVETDPGYGICLKGKTGKSLNLYGGDGACRFYTFAGDKASRWKIEQASSNLIVEDGKVYKISNYQDTPASYQIINSATASEVINKSDVIATNQGYWVCKKSNEVYTFASAMGDGKYLAWKGLSTTSKNFDLYFATTSNTTQCVSLYSHEATGGGRWLYVWKNSGGTNGWDQNGGPVFGSNGSTDYKFEQVTGVDVYTVVSNINAGGVTYSPSYTGTATQTKDGFYVFASAPSASDFTAISVTNYTPGAVTIDTSAKTITVNYTATITYTLTDVNGATYSWSASGTFGTAPTISGCYGSTLSNEVWNEESRTYTANVSFPFPVSSNGVTNWTYIGSYNVSGYADPNNFCWFVKSDDKVYIKKATLPTNEDGENEKFKWAIFPTNSNNQFSFKIKNESTGKFLYVAKEEAKHTGEQIILSEEGTGFDYFNGEFGQGWKIPTKNFYVSVGSSGEAEQNLGLWNSAHRGTAVAFFEPADFTTLMANLKTAYTSFNQYIPPFSSGTYTETVEGKMVETFATYNATTTNVIKDNPTAYLTASDFQKYTNAYNTAINGLQASIDENTFIRIRSMMSSDLINTPTYLSSEDKIIGGYHNCTFTQDNKKLTGKETIFYYDSDKHIIAFSNGNWLFDDAGYAEWNTSINHNKLNAEFDNVNIKFLHNSTNKYVYTKSDANGIYLDTDGSINSHEHNFLIEPVTSLPVTFNSAALGYATFNSPVALNIPKKIKVYVCTIEGETIRFFNANKYTDGDNWVLPANTPVLLYNEDYLTEGEETQNFIVTSTTEEYDDDFTGTVAAANPESGNTYYSLRKRSDGKAMGFYQRSGTAGALAGFRAWIKVKTEEARDFTIVFDGDSDPTGIVEALGLQNDNVEIFDLSGRKLSSYKNGINIVNGKKVFK